jgi:spermidine/putrescine-binding protein
MLDLYGAEKTRTHLISLSKNQVELDEQAKNSILALIKELSNESQSNLEHYNTHSYYLPRIFANDKNTVLIGYSERLYYTERELQLTPNNYPPIIQPKDIVIKQFSFSEKSQGTPSWTDGFVIPKGKLKGKRAAIITFLKFIQSNDAYEAFAEPTQYFAPSYLLPATLASYQEGSPLVKKQPLLPQFYQAMSDTFPVSNSEIWAGMRAAGSKLKKILKP